MLKSIFAAGVVIVSFSTLAIAAPFSTPETSSSVPLLSGNYVITLHKLCQVTLSVTTKSGQVTGVNLTADDSQMQAGLIKFKQGSKAGAGSFTLDETSAGGTATLIKQNSGTEGDTFSQATQTLSGTFSQTSTKISIMEGGGTETYSVYYGKVSGGIAQHAAFAGLDSKGCAEQGTLTVT
jgi:hypothetical protein